MDFEHLTEISEKCQKKRRSHAERETGFIFYHGERVSHGVIALRKKITADASHDDLLRCAALFHDLGKGFPKHEQIGAELTRTLLKSELSDEELNEVSRLILAHDCREPETDRWDIWAKLLQDADMLDHFGTIETWLNFHYSAHADEPIQASVAFYENEFFSYAETMRSKLNFEESKRIFDEKIAFAKLFYERMKVEATGGYVI